jgi:hypothetical protein
MRSRVRRSDDPSLNTRSRLAEEYCIMAKKAKKKGKKKAAKKKAK